MRTNARHITISLLGAALMIWLCNTPNSFASTVKEIEINAKKNALETAQVLAVKDKWWTEFGSNELNAFIERSLRTNSDLSIAAARLSQARALVGASNSDFFPQVALEANTSRGRETSADPKTNILRGGFHASWEPDFFGAKKLGKTAAVYETEMAQFNYQAIQQTIASEICVTYFEAQGLLRREKVLKSSIATLVQAIKVANRRYQAGQASKLDIDRLETELEQEIAYLTQINGAREIRLQQLSLLVNGDDGFKAQDIQASDGFQIEVPKRFLQADLLERRPDVQVYARQLAVAMERIGIAKRDLYPRIQFDWSGSKERMSINSASAAPSVVIGYGMSFSLPIFDGGRIRSNISIQESRAQEAMMAYEKAMRTALSDAAIALSHYVTALEAIPALQHTHDLVSTSAQRSERLFQAGQLDLNTSLDIKRSQLKAQDALIQGQVAKWTAAIAVRRAFGGGV